MQIINMSFVSFWYFRPLCSSVDSQVPSWYFVACLQPCCSHSHGEQCLSIIAVCMFYISIDTVLPCCDRENLPFCWPGHGHVLHASGEAMMPMLQ